MSEKTKPATRWAAITPSDTVNLPTPPRSIYVTGAGEIALVGDDDHVEVFPVDAKHIYPFSPKRVNFTDTSATGLMALY
jgi:hypothetical protein